MRDKRTNSIGAGKKNVTASISEAMYLDLKALAKESRVGISTYAVCVLVDAWERKQTFKNAREMKGRAANYQGTGAAAGVDLAKVALSRARRQR